MKQHDIATIFAHMADLLEYRGDNPFRIRAYRRAAQNLESFSGDLEKLAQEDRLEELSGIGADLAQKIGEFLSTGTIVAYERMRRDIPAGIFELLEVPGVGPKTAKLLNDQLHISNMAQLEEAAASHRLRTLPGFQETRERNILKGIEIVKQGRQRMHLGIAWPVASGMLEQLRTL